MYQTHSTFLTILMLSISKLTKFTLMGDTQDIIFESFILKKIISHANMGVLSQLFS